MTLLKTNPMKMVAGLALVGFQPTDAVSALASIGQLVAKVFRSKKRKNYQPLKENDIVPVQGYGSNGACTPLSQMLKESGGHCLGMTRDQTIHYLKKYSADNIMSTRKYPYKDPSVASVIKRAFGTETTTYLLNEESVKNLKFLMDDSGCLRPGTATSKILQAMLGEIAVKYQECKEKQTEEAARIIQAMKVGCDLFSMYKMYSPKMGYGREQMGMMIHYFRLQQDERFEWRKKYMTNFLGKQNLKKLTGFVKDSPCMQANFLSVIDGIENIGEYVAVSFGFAVLNKEQCILSTTYKHNAADMKKIIRILKDEIDDELDADTIQSYVISDGLLTSL